MPKAKSQRKQKQKAARRQWPSLPPAEVKFASIRRWCEISGIGLTTSYKLIAAGRLPARKLGSRLLVDVEAGLLYLQSLPVADVRLPNSGYAASNQAAP